jgi:SAM-dependent methyltransferase
MKAAVQSILLSLLLLSSACVPAASAQTARHPVTGRAYAGVMGAAGADWLERPEREVEERPSLAVKLLDLKPGMSVADVGCGSGYYTELISRRIGAQGKVFAVDVQAEMLELLKERVKSKRLANVVPVLGDEADPKLPDGALDLILLVDVYHEFAEPQTMLRKLRPALKPDGRLVLLEFRKEDPAVPIREEHKMSVKEVRAELEPEGFRFERVLNDLPWQHILIFRK